MRYTEKLWRVEWTVHGLELESRWITNPRDYCTTGIVAIRRAKKICERPGFAARVQHRKQGEPWHTYSTFTYTQ